MPNFVKLWISHFFEVNTIAYKFDYKTFKRKFVAFEKTFQHYITFSIKSSFDPCFLTFNDQDSNCQFDSQPFFWS
jgi:hypothetical protein